MLWCSERTASIAAIQISEASLAGGIKDSGLRQDRCEGQRGGQTRNPRGSHLYASRWLVEDVIVGENVSLQRKSPPGGFARSLSTSHRSRDPPSLHRVAWVPAPGWQLRVSALLSCWQHLAALLPGAVFSEQLFVCFSIPLVPTGTPARLL